MKGVQSENALLSILLPLDFLHHNLSESTGSERKPDTGNRLENAYGYAPEAQ